jgi:predicted nucleic acid-binding protein
VAYYSPEPLSEKAETLMRAEPQPGISSLTEVEFASALSRKVRAGELSRNDAIRIWSRFLSHLEASLYTRIEIHYSHFRMAREWIAGLTTALRTLDALHLAAAASESWRIVTADGTLARSAKQLGIASTLLK